MNFLAAVSVFHLAGILLAVPLVYIFVFLANSLAMRSFYIVYSVPIVLGLIGGVYIARKFYTWVNQKNIYAQRAIAIPLIIILGVGYWAEYIYKN